MSVKSTAEQTKKGYFGEYGGVFVPEALCPVLEKIADAYEAARKDPAFHAEFMELLQDYAGRPSPITECRNTQRILGGGRLFLKREDLNHTGAHKINNTIGQALLAKRMGKKKLIAETGAGSHGVAVATVAALMGFECDVYMGTLDIERQAPNVLRMRALGTRVVAVDEGNKGLKEAVDVALRALISDPSIFYLIGSAVGPHPYPTMVRHFQSVIGNEARFQMFSRLGRLPDYAIACVGGGSNSIGLFSGFIGDPSVKLIGAEPAGRGLSYGDHAATLCMGKPGVLHGYKSYVLMDEQGEAAPVYSISAGLDYPAVGPEHAFLKDSARAEYVAVSDDEALEAFKFLCKNEGIIPALESAHAIAAALRILPKLAPDEVVLVNLSGRGDKDMETIEKLGLF